VSGAVGRDVIPRLAAKLDFMPVTDVTAIHGPSRFDRPIYAGNAIETVSSNSRSKLLTLRASALPGAKTGAGGQRADRTASTSLVVAPVAQLLATPSHRRRSPRSGDSGALSLAAVLPLAPPKVSR